MIHFVIRNNKTNAVDHRCGTLRKISNTNKFEYQDVTVKMYDGIIWKFLEEAGITI